MKGKQKVYTGNQDLFAPFVQFRAMYVVVARGRVRVQYSGYWICRPAISRSLLELSFLCYFSKFLTVWHAHSLLAVGPCSVILLDSSNRLPINTLVDLMMTQSLLMRQTIINRLSRRRSRKPGGHFHVFTAELFPAI